MRSKAKEEDVVRHKYSIEKGRECSSLPSSIETALYQKRIYAFEWAGIIMKLLHEGPRTVRLLIQADNVPIVPLF